MFFYLSKVFWFFADPGNAFLFALLTGLILAKTRFKRTGKSLIWISVCIALFISVVPVGSLMLKTLEDRFPVPQSLPEKIDGIVVLGGVVDPYHTAQRKTPVIGGAIERITVSARLAHEYPGTKILYTGGSGSLKHQDNKEADYIVDLYEALGVPRDRLMLERESRNTWENAKYSVEIASPVTAQNWVLITSAFHMPRAVGAFRRVGWEMIPYPVDFNINEVQSFPSPLNFTEGLSTLSTSTHEWIGLISYWITGKNSAAFPKPR